MHRLTPLLPPRTHSRNIRKKPILLRLVRPRRELNQTVQGHLHPRTLLLGTTHEVGIDTPQDGLMRHDENILRTLQLHDDRLEPDDDVAVRFAAQVAVVVLVRVAGFEVVGVFLFDFGVGQAVADARIELVERFPGQLLVWKMLGCLSGAFEGRGPDGQREVAGGCVNEFREFLGVALASRGEVCIAADFAGEVVEGFAVLMTKLDQLV
jgi:hypothetical protein